jgi:hypothetical protein
MFLILPTTWSYFAAMLMFWEQNFWSINDDYNLFQVHFSHLLFKQFIGFAALIVCDWCWALSLYSFNGLLA